MKALSVTIFFALAGIVGFFITYAAYNPTSVPLAIFYAVLTFNTYFSIKLFSAITPANDTKQIIVDGLLVACYLALASAIHAPLYFFFGVLLLFIIAACKYVLLLGSISHPRLLQKKIFIDLCGVFVGAVAVFLGTQGYIFEAAWVIAIVFSIANVYLLLIKPMYRLID